MLLILRDPMIHGPHVRRVQETLEELGYGVGPKGTDGWYGKDTVAAVEEFQEDYDLKVDGEVGGKTWEMLEDIFSTGDALLEEVKDDNWDNIIHIVGEHEHPKWYQEARSPRPKHQIKGVTLHQTGVLMTDTAKRFRSLNAHIAVLRSGKVVIVNDPFDFIWHAQQFSYTDIGVEFNGNLLGLDGDLSTDWDGDPEHQTLTPEMVKAAEELKAWLQEWFARKKATWVYLHAHRQARASRRSDPGEEIWSQIALPWIDELGLHDGGPGWTIGDGLAIPKQWDPTSTARY